MKWIGSYAGYSTQLIVKFLEFVRDQSGRPVIFDPMCGGGNLFVACEKNNINYVGYDINPIQVIQAAAKLALIDDKEAQACLADVPKWDIFEIRKTLISSDWFHVDVVEALLSFYQKLTSFAGSPIFDVILAAFYLMLRKNACYGISSNPTWLKKGGIIAGTSIKDSFVENFKMILDWHGSTYGYLRQGKNGYVRCQDIRNITNHDEFDVCITSPPYCNRLDYRRMFGPELFIHSLIPGNTPHGEFMANNEVRGVDLNDYTPTKFEEQLLNVIRSKQAPENRDYYYKYYSKYFAELQLVLDKSIMSVKHNGIILINVQNSTYKKANIDLDGVIYHKLVEKHHVEELLYSNKPFFGNIRNQNAHQKETVLKIIKK